MRGRAGGVGRALPGFARSRGPGLAAARCENSADSAPCSGGPSKVLPCCWCISDLLQLKFCTFQTRPNHGQWVREVLRPWSCLDRVSVHTAL